METIGLEASDNKIVLSVLAQPLQPSLLNPVVPGTSWNYLVYTINSEVCMFLGF